VSLVGTSTAQRGVCVLLALRQATLLDLRDGVFNTDTSLDGDGGANRSDDLVLFDKLEVFGAGVELLVLAGLEREQDEAGLVRLQALDVGLQGLLGGGLAAVVDGDADGGCQFAGNTSSLCWLR
jgi:hypothetical protein